MKGLLVKEKYSICNTCKLFFIVPLAFYAVMIIGTVLKGQKLAGFPVGMIFMMMGLMPASIINQEMQSKWHIGVLTMPYTRNQIVSSKYIMALIITFITLIVTGDVMISCLLISGQMDSENVLNAVKMLFGGIGMGLMPSIIFMPVNFKFYNTVGGLRVLIGALLGGFMGGSNMMIMDSVQDGRIFGGGFVFMCLSLVLFLISWGVSILLFRKKDA
ncbi:ABC-2 transporter permease [Ruminococcus albus]|uniref:ABC-2 family transporter protein n=1 Tax=Ruminococcus albus TaxID=1264 RepID=A0A1I1LDA7_RUMAL|nr:ABC-2 transporter permease [Ruminococcus albus]SFC71054.1 ABC-2 family transporter protein [Ruminococcus albus]